MVSNLIFDVALAPFDQRVTNSYVTFYPKTGVSRALPDNPVAPKLRAIVDEFKKVVPVVQSLRNPALKERHWEEIEGALNHKFSDDDPPLKYTLGAMIDLGVVEKVELIEQASVKAIQEKVLKDMFAEKILTVWKHLEFEVMNYKDRNDTFIVGGIDPITEAFDDSLVTKYNSWLSFLCTYTLRSNALAEEASTAIRHTGRVAAVPTSMDVLGNYF